MMTASDSSPTPAVPHAVLIVEDDEIIREMLAMMVSRMGLTPLPASNGLEAMEILEFQKFDLVLLDLAMPEVDGYQVLQRIKKDLGMRRVPVIVLSGMTNVEAAIRCVELGADDFLTKPVNTTLLQARIQTCLEHKKLYDMESDFLRRLELEQERSERLLLNVLPASIARRLKGGEAHIAEHFPECTVMFADLVGFSRLASRVPPAELVQILNTIFSAFDRLADQHGLEKIKTIGDAYMLVGGVPTPRADHAEAVVNMAVEVREAMKSMHARTGHLLQMRIGIHSGPVVAGIIGTSKFSYDLWGETVNVASRMESQGRPGAIQVSKTTKALLEGKFTFDAAGFVEAKGIGQVPVFLLTGRVG
jgi:class 3 adenylate cyclase/CheY-like chemotaxis protein